MCTRASLRRSLCPRSCPPLTRPARRRVRVRGRVLRHGRLGEWHAGVRGGRGRAVHPLPARHVQGRRQPAPPPLRNALHHEDGGGEETDRAPRGPAARRVTGARARPQVSPGRSACTPCAEGEGTAREGAAAAAECRALCPPGAVSASGFAPCTPCDWATFQVPRPPTPRQPPKPPKAGASRLRRAARIAPYRRRPLAARARRHELLRLPAGRQHLRARRGGGRRLLRGLRRRLPTAAVCVFPAAAGRLRRAARRAPAAGGGGSSSSSSSRGTDVGSAMRLV
jgi:hypothetical protein